MSGREGASSSRLESSLAYPLPEPAVTGFSSPKAGFARLIPLLGLPIPPRLTLCLRPGASAAVGRFPRMAQVSVASALPASVRPILRSAALVS